MTMTQQETISTLNSLIKTAKDGEKGFLEASKHSHAPHLRSLFVEYSAECSRSASELQECVRTLGGSAETSGTAAGAMHRGWMNLKASVTSDDDLALLEECERGEDRAKAEYAKALKGDFTPAVKTILQRQHEGTLRHHDRIRDLRDRAKMSA